MTAPTGERERKVYEINTGEHAGSHLVIRPDGTASVCRVVSGLELGQIFETGDILDVTHHVTPRGPHGSRPPSGPKVRPDWLRVLD